MKKYFIKLTFHSLSIYPCERISISSDVTINVINARVLVWYLRLFCVLRENALCAHDITYAGHYEKSLLRDNDSCCYLCEMKIISSDWIALLGRLLISIRTCRFLQTHFGRTGEQTTSCYKHSCMESYYTEQTVKPEIYNSQICSWLREPSWVLREGICTTGLWENPSRCSK